MKSNVKIQLEASASGQTMRKRRSTRRKNSKPAELEQKKTETTRNYQAVVSELQQQHNVVFSPNPGPQEEFLAASEREVLYGGSAGGGKSFAMLADPLNHFHHPAVSGLL